MSDKRSLRAALRTARLALHGRPPPAPPRDFLDRLSGRPVVAAYVAIGGEADPVEFVAAARAAGCTLALPVVIDRATPICFARWAGPLVEGPFGLLQPSAEAADLAPDIILTPLVGFDRRGNRLGQGAGHYDRAFAEYPRAWRVGIAWSVQEVPALVPDPWDVPLHAVATETEWIVP